MGRDTGRNTPEMYRALFRVPAVRTRGNREVYPMVPHRFTVDGGLVLRFVVDHTIEDAPVSDAASSDSASAMVSKAAANVIELFVQTLAVLQTTPIMDSGLEGRIRSGYLPFRTQIIYRPSQNDRLRVMFGASLYRYHTATYPHASDSANRRTNDTIFVASMKAVASLGELRRFVDCVIRA
ncbi:hypothetical protein TNCV_3821331 [Trichonephila clavipes]|nr:hypothetical protein TNCV_3821331 [Trichonephila clavipes]